jgi:hypothetical protein
LIDHRVYSDQLLYQWLHQFWISRGHKPGGQIAKRVL